MQIDTLTIVGVGLIGGSIGQAARRRKIARNVIGVGRDAGSLERARATGAVDSFTTNLLEGVANADLIVFCTPVDRIAAQVLQAAPHCKRGCLITDAGSTKANIVHDLEGHLPEGVHFVGSHPLAGSEKRGPESASAELFVGRITVVTDTPFSDAASVKRLGEFWQALGSEVRHLDPERHDQVLAMTSHLPHLLASALAGIVPATWLPFAASGFRDTTRVASGDPALWTAIFRENALALCDALQTFSSRLHELSETIINNDDKTLIELLSQAKRVRDALGS